MKQFSMELGLALRQFIADPTDFFRSIALVNSLHRHPVYASSAVYAITIEGQTVTPVFTSLEDLTRFKQEQASAKQQQWQERSVLSLVEEVILNGISGLVFNVKRSGDYSNSTLFKSSQLIQFINTYTSLLNQLSSPDNQVAPLQKRAFLVPAFITTQSDGSHQRTYPFLARSQDKKARYIPAFTSLATLSDWYHHEAFGQPFKAAGGLVFLWQLNQVCRKGQDVPEDSLGFALDPMEKTETLLPWSILES